MTIKHYNVFDDAIFSDKLMEARTKLIEDFNDKTGFKPPVNPEIDVRPTFSSLETLFNVENGIATLRDNIQTFVLVDAEKLNNLVNDKFMDLCINDIGVTETQVNRILSAQSAFIHDTVEMFAEVGGFLSTNNAHDGNLATVHFRAYESGADPVNPGYVSAVCGNILNIAVHGTTNNTRPLNAEVNMKPVSICHRYNESWQEFTDNNGLGAFADFVIKSNK